MAIPHYSTRHTNERHTQETIVYQAAEIIRYLESRLREERNMPSSHHCMAEARAGIAIQTHMSGGIGS